MRQPLCDFNLFRSAEKLIPAPSAIRLLCLSALRANIIRSTSSELQRQMPWTRNLDTPRFEAMANAARLTHGGFYNHFQEQGDLLIESTRCASRSSLG